MSFHYLRYLDYYALIWKDKMYDWLQIITIIIGCVILLHSIFINNEIKMNWVWCTSTVFVAKSTKKDLIMSENKIVGNHPYTGV